MDSQSVPSGDIFTTFSTIVTFRNDMFRFNMVFDVLRFVRFVVTICTLPIRGLPVLAAVNLEHLGHNNIYKNV